MLNLVILLSVIGKVSLFNDLKNGTIEPRLPNTLPYLTTEAVYCLFPLTLLEAIISLSEQSFVAPYKFTGAAACRLKEQLIFF